MNAGVVGGPISVYLPFSVYGLGWSSEYPATATATATAIAERALRREDLLVIWGSGRQCRDFVCIDDFMVRKVVGSAPGHGANR